MSALTERVKDFWDRISPRERMLVVIAAIAAPITIVVWLGTSIQDGLDAMEARNTKMRKALVVVEDLRARGPAQPVDDVVATMPTEPLSLDTYLDNAAKKAGFTIKTTTPHTPVSKNGFTTNSVALKVDDIELETLKVFLQELETTSKVVAVTHLTVNTDFKQPTLVDASLEVSTYSKDAPKAEAGDGSGSAGAAKAGG